MFRTANREATAIYQPDWHSGKAVLNQISGLNAESLGIAGPFECRKTADGGCAYSFAILMLNSDHHAVFKELHLSDPKDSPDLQDKRMVAILPRGVYDAWLDAPTEKSMDFMKMFPADRLVAEGWPGTAALGGLAAR